MAGEAHQRRSDVLAMGLFGLAVGSLTLGLVHLGEIPERDHIGTMVVVLACSGFGPFLAGIATIRYHEPLCGVALTVYGFFWITVCTAKLVSDGATFPVSPLLHAQLDFVFFVCSAVMMFFTAYRSATLCLLFLMIAGTFFLTFLARLNLLTETLPGVCHVVAGLIALYHAVGSVTVAFTGHALVPLGPPLLPRRARAIQAVL